MRAWVCALLVIASGGAAAAEKSANAVAPMQGGRYALDVQAGSLPVATGDGRYSLDAKLAAVPQVPLEDGRFALSSQLREKGAASCGVAPGPIFLDGFEGS